MGNRKAINVNFYKGCNNVGAEEVNTVLKRSIKEINMILKK